ncbi:hypothetical protein [Ruegeria sp. 6PALISEP08]|uniref:hypothetical protein n=1 Tax=Ruegeria sp. 6PALISEP08 TaxID=1225660 RepID=UPI00067EE73F|nr:hypothetical protein [Ruegeria sp. 6PALISEP08]
MKLIFNLAVAACLVTGLTSVADAKDIKKKQQFMETIVGKKLVSGSTWLIVSADGKITGDTGKNGKVVGAWVWNKRYFCRNVVIGKNQLPEDCQKVSIDGNQVTFTREKGAGKATAMTISN